MAFQGAGPNFRAAEVLEDTDGPANFFGDFPDGGNGAGVGIVIAVRKVQARHVHSSQHHLSQNGGVGARGTQSANDLRSTHESININARGGNRRGTYAKIWSKCGDLNSGPPALKAAPKARQETPGICRPNRMNPYNRRGRPYISTIV